MALYAMSQGIKLPVEKLAELEMIQRRFSTSQAINTGPEDKQTIRLLAQIHAEFTKLIAPAKPATILYMQEDAQNYKWWKALGPVPLVRRLMLIGCSFLLLLIALSSTSYVDKHVGQSLFESQGIEMLVRLTFLLSAAGIGGAFGALFKINEFISTNTYDRKYDSTYYSRLILGLIAGIMLAELIPIEVITNGSLNGEEGNASASQYFVNPQFTKVLFAILGGFSSNAVYNILDRLVFTIESFIKGKKEVDWEEFEKKAQLKAEAEVIRNKIKVAGELSALLQHMNNNKRDDKAFSMTINNLIEQLIEEDRTDIRLTDQPAELSEPEEKKEVLTEVPDDLEREKETVK